MSRATERRRAAAIGAVILERDRQECMKASGRFEFTCADDGMTNAEKLTVLVEEVGEVAQEVLTQDGRRLARDTVGTPEALLKEVVQVAAVALAWIEALQSETLAAGEHCYPPSVRRDVMAGPPEEFPSPGANDSSLSPAASALPDEPCTFDCKECNEVGRCLGAKVAFAAGENETPPSETAQVALSALGLSPAANASERVHGLSAAASAYLLDGRTNPVALPWYDLEGRYNRALETGVRPLERGQSKPAEDEPPPVSSAMGSDLLQRNQHEAAGARRRDPGVAYPECDCAFCQKHYPHSDL